MISLLEEPWAIDASEGAWASSLCFEFSLSVTDTSFCSTPAAMQAALSASDSGTLSFFLLRLGALIFGALSLTTGALATFLITFSSNFCLGSTIGSLTISS